MTTSALAKLAEDLSNLHDVEEFWNRIGSELSQFGVTSFLYGAIASKKEVREHGFGKTVVFKSNHPKEFLELFEDAEFLENDLTACRILEETKLTFWHHEELWSEASAVQKNQSELEDDFGLQVGVTIPTEILVPGVLGGVSICTGELTPEEFDQMWLEHSNQIYQILSLLTQGMNELFLASIIGLAPREKEVLEHLAIGLRPDQIADRLDIGYRTVDKYIVGAKYKLKTATRDQAVAKALIFNIIDP